MKQFLRHALLAPLLATSLHAYTYDNTLPDVSGASLDGFTTRGNGADSTYIIPAIAWPDSITFTARGGDGGKAYANGDTLFSSDKSADGGGGAVIQATFPVDLHDENALMPGGEIRFVAGSKGDGLTKSRIAAGGGGGASGVLYRAPVDGADWELLLIAGGGGGASACADVDDGTFESNGGNANTGTAGDNAGSGSAGGTNGAAGKTVSSSSGGGAGWLESATGEVGGKKWTSGGAGGTPDGTGSDGGFGIAGGGAGYRFTWEEYLIIEAGGGGGGGYSGGAAGYAFSSSYSNAGGGGGSYIDDRATWSDGSTRSGNNKNGYVSAIGTANAANVLPGPTFSIQDGASETIFEHEADTYSFPAITAADFFGQPVTNFVIQEPNVNGIGSFTANYTATDQFGNSSSVSYIVHVVAANKPTFDLLGDVEAIQGDGGSTENNFAYNFNANDSGQSLDSYEVTNNNQTLFAIQPAIDNNGTLTFELADAYSGTATVSVVAIDDPDIGDNGRSLAKTFTITVIGANKPTFDLAGNITVLQTDDAQSVTSYATNFNGNDQGHNLDSYEVSNNNNALFITQPTIANNGTLTFTPVATASGSATVSVVAIDIPFYGDNGRSITHTFTITLQAATKPTFDMTPAITLDEDAGAQSIAGFVSNFNANDSGQSLHGYEVSYSNGSLFSAVPTIDNAGRLTFTSGANLSGVATVSVVAVDDPDIGNNGRSLTKTFTITVNPVSDAPTNLTFTVTEIDEEVSYARVGIMNVDNSIGGAVTWAITGGADAAVFWLEPAGSSWPNGIELQAGVFDYENPTDANGDNVYEITVTATNAEGTISGDYTLTINDVNEAPPSLSLDTLAVDEGEIFVGTLSAADPENDTLTYAVAGGADASKVTVDANTGEVSFVQTPDYEMPADLNGDNTYRVTFRVSDGSLTLQQLMIITVHDVDEAPVGMKLDAEPISSVDLPEDAPDGALLGVLGALDPEEAGAVTFSLTDDAGGRFEILNDNQLVVADAGLIDYEINQVHEVIIRATDATGMTSEAMLTINIADVLEPELFMTIGTSTIAEDAAGAATTGTVTRFGPTTDDLIITLTSSDTSEAFVPATVVIPSGESSVEFNIDALDDTDLDGDQIVTIGVTADGYIPAHAEITVTDVEGFTVLVSPSTISEADGPNAVQATVYRSDMSNLTALTVTIGVSDHSEITAVSTVSFAAGESAVSFYLNAVDDILVDGDQSVTITASADGYESGTAHVTVTDPDIDSDLAQFRGIYGLAADGSDDDSDWSGNGIANIFYLIFGLGDPGESVVDRARLPQFTATTSECAYSYIRPESTNLGIHVMTSDDLTTWEDVDTAAVDYKPLSEETVSLGGGYELVTVYFARVAGENLRFYLVQTQY